MKAPEFTHLLPISTALPATARRWTASLPYTLTVYLILSLPSPMRAANFVEIKADIEITRPPTRNSSDLRKSNYEIRCVAGAASWMIEGHFARNARQSYWLIGDNLVKHTVITRELSSPLAARMGIRPLPVGHESTTVYDCPRGIPIRPAPALFISWLAFSSGTYLIQEGRRVPFYSSRPVIVDGFGLAERDPTYSEETLVFDDGYGLPRSIETGALEQRHKNSYKVLASTNFQGRTLPLKFKFTQSMVGGDGRLVELFSAIGTVTSIQAASELELSEQVQTALENQEPVTFRSGRQRVKETVTADAPIPLPRRAEATFEHESFTFVRIIYSTTGSFRIRTSMWATDYPDSDLNFSARFQKETGLKTDPNGKVMKLTDPNLKGYPFVYLVEGGGIELSQDEIRGLREYLLGGGFLMVDDFWGEPEWKSIKAQFMKVFPERAPVDLSIDHPVFHCFYEIPEKPQVPNVALGIQSQSTGVTWERPDAKEPHYRGLIDDNGRLMAIFCHNTDLGDGWEREGENEYYYREFSLKKAYPMGINIVVYALTH